MLQRSGQGSGRGDTIGRSVPTGRPRTRPHATWPWYTGRAHQAGLFVHCWTIDDRWEMWMVKLGGADGIFTNRTELALAVYGRATHGGLDRLWNEIGYE